MYLSILIALGGISFLAWLNHRDFEKAMVSQTEEELLSIARSQGQGIEKYIVDINQELVILSADTAIQNGVAGGIYRPGKKGYSVYLEDSFKDIGWLVDAVYLVDIKGRVIDSSPYREGVSGTDLSKMPDVQDMLLTHSPYVSGVFKTTGGVSAISSLQPVFRNGEFKGFLRAVILIDRVNNLISHLNQKRKRFAFLIDDNANLMGCPDKGYLGMNVREILSKDKPDPGASGLSDILRKMNQGRQGAGIVGLLPPFVPSGPVRAIVAFTPIDVGKTQWSIAMAEDYESIAGPIKKNNRDNLIFTAFVLFLFFILGFFFFNMRQKETRLETSMAAVSIINKQLYLEIDERRKIEKALTNFLPTHKKKK